MHQLNISWPVTSEAGHTTTVKSLNYSPLQTWTGGDLMAK